MKHLRAHVLRVACLTAGCLTALTSGTASALSCASNWVQAPEDGAVDVPTNTLLWGYDGPGAESSSTRLIGPNGPVQLEQRYLPVYSYGDQRSLLSLLVPAAELAPNARYRIEVRYPAWEGGEASVQRKTFMTGSGATEQAPLLELLSSEPGASEDSSRWRELEFSHTDILIGDSGSELGAVTSVSDLLSESGQGAVLGSPDRSAARWLTRGASLSVGLGDCMIWPASSVERVQARFGGFDLAGNFSGWVDVPELTLPDPEEVELALEQRRAEAAAREAATYVPNPRHGAGHNMGCASLASPKPGGGAFAVLALLPLFVSVARRRLRR